MKQIYVLAGSFQEFNEYVKVKKSLADYVPQNKYVYLREPRQLHGVDPNKVSFLVLGGFHNKPFAEREELWNVVNAIKDIQTQNPDSVLSDLFDVIPGLSGMKILCPGYMAILPRPYCTECRWSAERPLCDVIIHLNDSHKWTRDAIADWLETLDFDLTIRVPTKIRVALANRSTVT